MKKGIFLLACLIGMSSCTDHKDVFDPNAEAEKKKEEYDKNFPVTDIDPNQDWNTFTIVKASVTVNEDWGENYVVKIYTANPLDENSGALLLAKGEIKSGETFSTDIELPRHFLGVFVSRTDKAGGCIVKFVQNSGYGIIVTFGLPTENNRARSYTGSNVGIPQETRECPYTFQDITEMLKKARELDSEASYNNAGPGYYKVTESKNYCRSLHGTYGKTDLFVVVTNGATLTISKGTAVQTGICLIVVDGILKLEENVTMPNAVNWIILDKGKIEGETVVMNDGSDGILNYNAGKIEVNTLNLNGGSFYNCGIVNVANLSSTSQGGEIINSKFLQVTNIVNTVNSKIYNNCYMQVETLNQFSLCQLADNSYLKVSGTLQTGHNAFVKLGKSAVLEANTFRSNGATIVAPSSNSSTNYDEYAFLKLGYVTQWSEGKGITGYYIIDPGDYVTSPEMNNWNNINSTEWKNNNWLYTPYAKFKNQALGELSQNNATPVAGQNVIQAKLTITPPILDECSASVIMNGNSNEDEMNYVYYAFEDFGSVGDYDFNDVILRVSHIVGSSTATVELVAAGGTLATTVKYKESVLWEEVHRAFGVELSTMVNTGRGGKISLPSSQSIQVNPDARFEDLRFSIKVTYSDGVSTNEVVSVPSTGTGRAPQYLCVPGQWKWPRESVSITSAYKGKNGEEGHSFVEWAGDSSKAQDWYLYPTTELVMGTD